MVLVYLPPKLGHLWGFNVGKYTINIPYMDHLGNDNISYIPFITDIPKISSGYGTKTLTSSNEARSPRGGLLVEFTGFTITGFRPWPYLPWFGPLKLVGSIDWCKGKNCRNIPYFMRKAMI